MTDSRNPAIARIQDRVSRGMLDRKKQRLSGLLRTQQITQKQHDNRQRELVRREELL